jgi:predicted Zn-ribbon and HTH transcriptional regulator
VSSKLKVDAWRCERCGHVWVAKAATVRPVTCPHCKSPYWNKPRQRKAKKNNQG